MLLCLVLLSLGCADAATAPTAAPDRLHPTLGIDPAISDLALSAVVMWERATGGRYAPSLHLGCDGSEDYCIVESPGMLDQCLGPDDAGAFNGCCDSAAHEIRLSESMMLDEKVSTLAHELGHSLGLGHGETGLMSVGRDHTERHEACIDRATLDAFAARHGTDPAALEPTCYGADVRTQMLVALDALR